MAEARPFYCLRCQHRFTTAWDAKAVVERSCPKCGSNSVRLAPAAPAAGERRPGADAKGEAHHA